LPRLSPIPGRRLRRVFELAGFVCVRTEGDHLVLTKPGLPRLPVIPDYDAGPVFVIRNNLRTAGLSREEYFRLLEST
jgi:predicted RNA binding protein YcfA (HicA-like mRNA interferase family)